MKIHVMFRCLVASWVVAGLGCAEGTEVQQGETTERISSALTGPLQFDFEDGQVLPWKPFGSPTLTNSTEQAFTGTHSLKTTNRTSGFMGPSIELSSQLSPGATYRVSTAVRLAAGEVPTTMKMTVMRTPTGGSATFEPVIGASNSNVTADGWVTLTGTYSFSGSVSGLLMYVESASATASYYIDTFSLVQSTPPPLSFDFEDGQVSPWFTFGSPTLTNVTEQAVSGTHSLRVTNRTASFMGPGLNVLTSMTKGATYQITVSARLVAGQAQTNVLASFSRTPTGGTGTFDTPLTLSNVTDQAWVTGTSLYTLPTDNSSLTFFIQTQNGNLSSFYVDAISIAQVAPPPGPPANTAGASATFESNTREGWKPRIGSETLTPTSADAHSGGFSLLTTTRTAAFAGPAFDVTNVMFNGSRYAVSVWAKLAPGQPDSQLRVSLQRTAGSISTFHTVVGNTTVTANAWVRLQATYDVAVGGSSLTLYLESNSGTASFYIDDFSIVFVQPAIAERDIPSVYQTLATDFPIVGAAVIPADIVQGSEPAFLLSKHFNSITSGNDMKWDATEASEGVFTFGQADAEVAFAKANNMHVRGHTLVWHNQIPAWVFTDPTTGAPMQPSPQNRALLIQRMQNHITTVMKHFDGDVPIWDVVNEPFDQSQPDGLRRSPWYNIIGPDYIDIALQAAHAASPMAKLYINDFDTTNPAKRDVIVAELSSLKARGIPIDGFGHQMHNNVEYPPAQTIIDAINLVATTNVEQSVTELDYSIYSGSFNTPFTSYTDIPQSRHNLVGYSYLGFLQALKQVPGKIVSLTIWGTSDDKSWLTSSSKVDAPLLFDPSLKKKPAYWAFVDPLQLPGADLSAALSAAPTTVPAGQGVAYTVTVTNNADTNQASFDPTDDDLPAANVAMTISIPSHTIFQGLAMPTGWACTTPGTGGTGQVRCTIASLAVGASAQFALTVAQSDCSQPDGAFISASASVTSTTADPNPAPNNTATTSVQVTNPPPVITANGSLSTAVECHTSYSELGASAVDACEGAVAVTISGSVDVNTVGTYGIRYDAVDLAGGHAVPVVRTVQVSDNTSPQLGVLTPAPLTPPDHRYVNFPMAALVSAASDTCDGTVGIGSVVITQVTSDEPDDGNGDGNTVNDIVIAADCRSVQLRVERAGPLNGRVYHVTLRVTDVSGNSTIKVATVTVPKDDITLPAIDDGPALTVASACN